MRGDEFFVKMAARPPFTKLHPEVAAFLKDYLGGEKVIQFCGRFVVNTQFPPYPSPAFDRLAENFGLVGDAAAGRLYSVTLAVTNRCSFACWHCYNAGRSQDDLPPGVLRKLAAVIQEMGAVVVTLTGGEPLLRHDLEEIAGCFDPRTCLIVGTTGDGLTPERAARLAAAGVFGAGISLDAENEAEHDRLRGRPGAFRIALAALDTARNAGLYPYVVAVATRQLLERARFFSFLRFARQHGALEVHLLEPSLTGKLAGRTDVALRASARRTIVEYQRQVAQDDNLPILSSFTYLEGPDAFGCGAGLTHLYIDGSGEVCPCNLVPLSFGNIAGEPLQPILDRMRRHFRQPRTGCVGRVLAPHIPMGTLPAAPEVSDSICARCLPPRHNVPRFFAVRSAAAGEVGREELRAAYDGVHRHYDEFWLVAAAQPIRALVDAIRWRGGERVFEAGCGTGYATALLARRAGAVVAADISTGMQQEAGRRLEREGLGNARLIAADAIEALKAEAPFDIVFSSWVLGYIPLAPFFAAAAAALVPGGQVAVVVHRENSPQVPLEIFGELVARDPSVLQKRVAFDFPRGAGHLRRELAAAGLEPEELHEGTVVFRYDSAAEVLEHLLKSGAGTAFYEAIDPARRDRLTREFMEQLAARQAGRLPFEVVHDYLACIARHPE
jgi:MoaA/NifB/PqqE/SkfB family radical SAM enzyme/protein-L-isoaspartate O-methyltransferase